MVVSTLEAVKGPDNDAIFTPVWFLYEQQWAVTSNNVVLIKHVAVPVHKHVHCNHI